MKNLSNNAIINLSIWNSAINSTRFPEYLSSWRTEYVKGGMLDAYSIAGNSFILNTISDNKSRYNDNKDTRSNYMTRSYTNPSGWTTATNFTSRLNTFAFTSKDARLPINTTTGEISTLNTSIYLIYAEMIVSSISSHAYGELYIKQDANNVVGAYEPLTSSGHSAWIHVSFLSLYQAADFTTVFRIGGNGTIQIRFGYTEFIGNKNDCGKKLL